MFNHMDETKRATAIKKAQQFVEDEDVKMNPKMSMLLKAHVQESEEKAAKEKKS